MPRETSYWSLPESALDDPEEAGDWGRRALAAAQAIKAVKTVRRKQAKGRGTGAPVT